MRISDWSSDVCSSDLIVSKLASLFAETDMITLYGIKNCDTVQRALKRLSDAGIACRFHDFKTDGLDIALAQSWVDALGVDVVVNRKGTTWRKLDEATRNRSEERRGGKRGVST